MKKGKPIPKSSQTSISFIYDVVGSFEVTESFKVYITNIIVTLKVRLVVKYPSLIMKIFLRIPVVKIKKKNAESKKLNSH